MKTPKIVVILTSVVIIFLIAVGNTLPALASGISTVPTVTVTNVVDSTGQGNPLQKHIVLKKLVCRYINGTKRCWDE